MTLYLGSLLGGVAQGQDLAQQAEARKLQQQKLAYDFEQSKQANARALQAEQGASATFGRMFAPPPVSGPANQGPMPPAPGQASMPTQQPQMMGPPQAGPNNTPNQPAAPQRPAIPPYQTVQGAGQQQQAMQGAQQAQQAQAMQAPPAVGVQPQQQQPQFTIQGAIQSMQQAGVPQDQWMAQLDRIKPYLDMQQRQQLAMLQEQDRQERLKNEDRRLTNQERNIDSMIAKRGGAGSGAQSMYDNPSPGGTPSTPPKTQKTGEDLLKSLDPKVARDVQAVAEGRMSLKNVSLRNNERRKLENLVNQYTDGKFNEQDVAVASKALQAFGTGKQGDLVRSSNTINEHMVDLRDAVKALNNKDITSLNRVGNQIAQWSGGAAPTDFNTVKTFVGDEVAKFLIPGVGSVKDREEVKNLLSTASSPEQLNKAIGRFESLMGGQLRSLQQQYKGSTSRDDFDRLLNSRSKQLLGGGGASTEAEGIPAGWSVREK